MIAEWAEIIKNSAAKGLELQGAKGEMPSGHNGPWKDPQTPVRNTAHWCILFLEAYKLTHHEAFKSAALRAADFLSSQEARPMNAAFYCRYSSRKDCSNGLIGQAWVIQALLYTGQYFERACDIELAEQIFLLHDFDDSSGLWRVRNVDGSPGGISHTFNQQLWFAVVGVLLGKLKGHPAIMERTDRFFEQMMNHLEQDRSGRIIHVIGHVRLKYRWLKRLYRAYRFRQSRDDQFLLEHGYHSFNLYALALLYRADAEHVIWQRADVRRMLGHAIQYTRSAEYQETIARNRYSAPYNPVGIEMAAVLSVFDPYLKLGAAEEAASWARLQLDSHYSYEQRLMNRNTSDPDTLAARLYEAELFLRRDDEGRDCG